MENFIRNFNRIKYGLLTKHKVKMGGYFPSFFCVFMDGDGIEVHKLSQKEIFLAGHNWLSRAGKIAPSWVSNHSTRFGLSCSLTELAV